MPITLPYTIANGQAIDATPVMANFNALAGLTPVGGAVAAASGANSDITSLSGLSTPLSVAQGGTGNNGGVWSAASLAVAPTTGAITSATASVRYRLIGKTVLYQIAVSITNNGTGGGSIQLSGLPWTFGPGSAYMCSGRENAVTGKTLIGVASGGNTALNVFNYDNSYPGATGAMIALSGVGETA